MEATNELMFEKYILKEEFKGSEVNYVVTDDSGYVCRLVPNEFEFVLSSQDIAIKNIPKRSLIKRISDFIVERNA